MTETLLRARMRDDGCDQETIDDKVADMWERKYQERRDRELEDRHILKLEELYNPY